MIDAGTISASDLDLVPHGGFAGGRLRISARRSDQISPRQEPSTKANPPKRARNCQNQSVTVTTACSSTTSPIALSSPATRTLVALDCLRRSRKLLAVASTTFNSARKTSPAMNSKPWPAPRRLRTENQKLKTAFLINSRSDIALACGAQGVHLPSHDISPSDVRGIWAKAGHATQPLITVSCHSAHEVARAASEQADFAIFAPVFEKKDAPHVNPPASTGCVKLAARRPPSSLSVASHSRTLAPVWTAGGPASPPSAYFKRTRSAT